MKKWTAIPDTILDEPNDHWLCESIYVYLLELFNNQYPPAKELESRTDIPEVAKNVWYLWLFASEVSSSGIPDYLLNHCPSTEQLNFTHRALKIVQAHELVMLLEAAISLARLESDTRSGFGEVLDHEWMNQFQVNPLWTDRQSIAVRSWELTTPMFFSLLAKYVRMHREDLRQERAVRKGR